MLNFIWGGMLILGIIFGVCTGKSAEVTTSLINGGKDAVNLAITMAGIIAFWCGIMKIAENSGIIKGIAKKLMPLMRFLFPQVPKHHKAMEYIATNLAANFLGLGWAATPAGLMAMKELQSINRDKTTASQAMCMFMIINMSSVQLIGVNIIAYRAQYLSHNPSEIILPSIIATCGSTIAGIIAACVYERRLGK